MHLKSIFSAQAFVCIEVYGKRIGTIGPKPKVGNFTFAMQCHLILCEEANHMNQMDCFSEYFTS